MLWDHAFFTEKVYQEEEILGMGIEWGYGGDEEKMDNRILLSNTSLMRSSFLVVGIPLQIATVRTLPSFYRL